MVQNSYVFVYLIIRKIIKCKKIFTFICIVIKSVTYLHHNKAVKSYKCLIYVKKIEYCNN